MLWVHSHKVGRRPLVETAANVGSQHTVGSLPEAIRAYAEQTGAKLLVVEIPPEIEERVVQAVAEADDRKSSGPA